MSRAHLNSREILNVVAIYGGVAALWILASDRAMEWLFADPAARSTAALLKGWFFVVVTSALLYGLLHALRRKHRYAERRADTYTLGAADTARTGSSGLFDGITLAMIVAVTVLTATGMVWSAHDHRDHVRQELETISELKRQQLSAFISERLGDATHYASMAALANGVTPEFFKRLDAIRWHDAYSMVRVVRANGDVAWQWGGGPSSHDTRPELVGVIAQAIAIGTVRLVAPYLDASGHAHLDLVAPLADGHHALLLHTDPNSTLSEILAVWPSASASGEFVLFRSTGEHIEHLNHLTLGNKTPLSVSLNIETPNRISARVIRGDASTDTVLDGTDYRDSQVLGIVRAIPGTDWFLLAKLDRSELDAEVWRDLVWICLAGLLAMFAVLSARLTLRQRTRLELAEAAQEAQHARLLLADDLEKSEGRLKALFEGAQDGILIADHANQHFVDANPAMCALLGYTRAELLAKSVAEIHPPDQFARATETFKRQAQGLQQLAEDIPMLRADGQQIHVDISVSVIDRDGKRLVVGFFRDSSHRHAASAALRLSEERMRAVIDNAADAMFVTNARGAYTYVNENACQLLGRSAGELLTMRISDVSSPENLAGAMAGFARLLETGRLRQNIELLHSDGHCIPVELHASRLPDGRFLGSCRDISERLGAEAALRASETFSRAILDAVAAHVCVIDRDGLITATNARWREFAANNSGTDYRCHIGANYISACAAAEGERTEEAAAVVNGIQAVLDGTTADFSLEYPCDSPTEKRWFLLTVTPLDAGQSGAVIVHTDITANRLVEEQLREHLNNLERFQRITVDRELDMIRLKQQINALCAELNRAPPFSLSFLADDERTKGAVS